MVDGILKDRQVLITGATSGIGKETAIGLAGSGASIVFTTRDVQRGKQVREEIESNSGNGAVEFLYCDLASFEFANRLWELSEVYVSRATL